MRRPEYNVMIGDCRELLAKLPERHFQCCVTSPPYWGLRNYQVDGQLGLEQTPEEYVAGMLDVFCGVWRVLRDDAVLWLNIGDSFADKQLQGIPWRVAFALQADGWYLRDAAIWHKPAQMPGSQRDRCTSAYEFVFQLTKQPRYYFDMEAVKESSNPSSVARLSQDVDSQIGSSRANGGAKTNGTMKAVGGPTRTPRNVWTIAHEGFRESHFATYPVALPLKCIKATTSERGCCSVCGVPVARVVERKAATPRGNKGYTSKCTMRNDGDRPGGYADASSTTTGWQPTCDCNADTVPCRVLDPFNGAGTTGVAAIQLGHDYTGLELNPDYAEMSERRIGKALLGDCYVDESKTDDAPLFAEMKEQYYGK